MLEPNVKVNVKNGVLPNLKGLMGKNIIPQLENQGYRVDYKGVGKIKNQFPMAGTVINKNQSNLFGITELIWKNIIL